MSWSDRRRVLRAGLAVLALPLGGCFRPMLAESGAAGDIRGRVALPEIEGRFGYHLYSSLEDRLGTPAEPLWRLEVETDVTEDDLAITPDSAITRKSLTAKANYRLTRIDGGEPVLSDSVISQSGYNSTASLYATRAVRRETEERLARDLGERIARRVLAAAGRLGRA